MRNGGTEQQLRRRRVGAIVTTRSQYSGGILVGAGLIACGYFNRRTSDNGIDGVVNNIRKKGIRLNGDSGT